jgi:hypothetical protein
MVADFNGHCFTLLEVNVVVITEDSVAGYNRFAIGIRKTVVIF